MDESHERAHSNPTFRAIRMAVVGRYSAGHVRKKGLYPVIAGFSFLRHHARVATLIIVMAVMNGFRQQLLDKILGLNGHLLVQPLNRR